MDDEKVIDPRYIEMLRPHPGSGHKNNDDAMAKAMAGISLTKARKQTIDEFVHAKGRKPNLDDFRNNFELFEDFVKRTGRIRSESATAYVVQSALEKSKEYEIPHFDIPHRQDIFQPTKSVLDAIDEDIDRQLTAFGNVNGFPVIFVMFDKSMERKDGKTTCGFELRMFKADQMSEAASFAKSCAGELGVYGAEGSHQESARQHKDDIDIRLDNVSYRSEFMQAPIIEKDKDCIKPVVPSSICAPGYESGLAARSSANSSGGEFWINSKRSKDEIIDDLIKKVKRLEDERDYWKREAEGKNGDDDTLGIFRHWDD